MVKKLKRFKWEEKNAVPPVDELNILFLKFCVKVLRNGDIDEVGKIIRFMEMFKLLQEKSPTYERVFLLHHLERHGLLGEDVVQSVKDCPLTKEEAEELKEIFGDQIDSIEELTCDLSMKK